uniref:galactinol--sucrose galactosyltransferase n=1 Tax=Salix viminalis TaxID=40686 RepID=A0A6N2N915_SALVM
MDSPLVKILNHIGHQTCSTYNTYQGIKPHFLSLSHPRALLREQSVPPRILLLSSREKKRKTLLAKPFRSSELESRASFSASSKRAFIIIRKHPIRFDQNLEIVTKCKIATMTVTPKISINDGNLVVHGKTILTGVPDSIVLNPGSGAGLLAGAFIGATASHSKSLHVFPVGVLEGLRFVCCFRFKLWWMTQRMGKCGKDIPLETQFMLVESRKGDEGVDQDDAQTIYTVFLPLLEGQFRAVLQGNDRNEMEICLESGDSAVETNQGLKLVYMHAGTNPFEVINQAVKDVEKYMQTFLHREKKKLPSFLDWFGWCTWDAFYTDVTAEGVEEGLESLSEGGTPPRFLIIDDGWQQIETKAKEEAKVVVQEGAQFASRLTGIKENSKFQKNGEKNEQAIGLKHVVDDAKQCHDVCLCLACFGWLLGWS